MNTYSHPIPAEWLSAYYDGELDAARRAQVEAHLPGCADCQRELAELKALNEALATDTLDAGTLTDPGAFWNNLKPQLADRLPTRPAAAQISAQSILLRWLPGIGLLLLNGAVQVGAVVGTLFMLISTQLPAAPAWVSRLDRLAAASTLGWLTWLVPVNLSGVGLFAFWLIISAGLAVPYLAWLGYELRYGRLAVSSQATA